MIGAEAITSVANGRSDPSPELSRQSRFEILSARRRRDVLKYLFDQRRQVGLRELSEQIAAWENDIEAVEVTYKQRTRVYTALRQNHLPKMDQEGVVDFDARSGEVELTEEAQELASYLDDGDRDRPWAQYYLGLTGVAGALVVAAASGVPLVAAVPGVLLAAAVTAAFAAVAVAQAALQRGEPGT